MINAKGYAVQNPKSGFAPFEFKRRELRPNDVLIDILYCGICHSDIHQARNEWGGSSYPMVPGHELVGRVSAVGSSVKKFSVGDNAGVGCMVGSCGKCDMCKAGEEQFCSGSGTIWTYNSADPISGGMTYGGYSDKIVVDESFALKIQKNADLSKIAPLLCAGMTTYSPLKHWGVGNGTKVGVIGLGGLGHMAVKLAHSMGAHVTVFTTSESKVADAKRFGAEEVIISKDKKAMGGKAGHYDFILDAVSAPHDLNEYIDMLAIDGSMVLVGLPTEQYKIMPQSLIFGRKSLGGSLIGGIKETQEMLDYCAEHGITSDIELIPIQKIDEAYERTLKSDVRYRFVIDMKSLSAQQGASV